MSRVQGQGHRQFSIHLYVHLHPPTCRCRQQPHHGGPLVLVLGRITHQAQLRSQPPGTRRAASGEGGGGERERKSNSKVCTGRKIDGTARKNCQGRDEDAYQSVTMISLTALSMWRAMAAKVSLPSTSHRHVFPAVGGAKDARRLGRHHTLRSAMAPMARAQHSAVCEVPAGPTGWQSTQRQHTIPYQNTAKVGTWQANTARVTQGSVYWYGMLPNPHQG